MHTFIKSVFIYKYIDKMDYSNKTRQELIDTCKRLGLKGYSGKKKEEILSILQSQHDIKENISKTCRINKKNRGQFYTTNSSYILDVFLLPPDDIRCIIEPFAGKGYLIDWLKNSVCNTTI